MRVLDSPRAIVLRSRNPERICQIIPKARRAAHNGKEVLVVPHGLHETKVLRNLGIDAPAPILHHYEWPRAPGLEPFHAQKETAAFLSISNRAYCLNDLGTGKSLAALWAYDYLRKTGHAKAALVVAPLSTLVPTWVQTIEDHLPHLSTVVLHGTAAQRRKLLARHADVYIINHDGIRVILDELVGFERFSHVILDELAEIARNQRTFRWRAANQLINQKDRKLACWGLTGTPTPRAPTDAYGQAKLLTPETAPPYFARFREEVMYQAGLYRWLERSDATEKVFKLLQPSIRYERSDCIDLPPTTYVDRRVELTPQQQKAYTQMHNNLVTQAAAGTITAVNEGVKVAKLVQICCGMAYDSDKEVIEFDAKPRLNEVLNLIDESASKTLVFVPYIAALHQVTEFLEKHGVTVAKIYSGTKKVERDEAFGRFQRQRDPHVLVCQPDAMSHGLTLTAAATIVWYAPTMNPGTYEQANGRITRPGQKHNTLIVHIEGSPMERKIYKRLKDRQAMQGLLLDMVHSQKAA